MIGGGEAEWNKILDHIEMSLEFTESRYKSFKNQSKWFIKYFGMDPYEENNLVNEHISYNYKEINCPKNIACTSSSKMPDLDKVEYCIKSTSYHNIPLVHYAEECVAYGYEFFGKYLRYMWD